MHHDAQEKARSCKNCQNYTNISTQPPKTLTSIASPWPFSQWGVDLIGPLPKEQGGVAYVIVVVDYFTKWVETEALNNITEKNTTDFIWRNIVCRYEIPHTLITDKWQAV